MQRRATGFCPRIAEGYGGLFFDCAPPRLALGLHFRQGGAVWNE